MRILKYTALFFLALVLGGCGSVAFSPSGGEAPILKQPIPKTNRILLVSSLGRKVQFVDETGLRYYKARFVTQSAGINQSITSALKQQLQARDYAVTTKSLPHVNPLNSADVQTSLGKWSNRIAHGAMMTGPLRGRLTDATKAYLNSLNRSVQADTIMLVVRDPETPSTYGVTCDKQHNAMVDVFFKLYVIDAKTDDILTWMPGDAQGKLPNSIVCRNPKQATNQQINQLTQAMTKPTVNLATEVLDRTITVTLQPRR